MLRLIITSLVILIIITHSGGSNNSDTSNHEDLKIISEIKVYSFSPDDQNYLKDAQPIIIPAGTPLKKALDSLGRHLVESYFSKTYIGQRTDIHFDVRQIYEIATPTRMLRVAVVNMVDPDRIAERCFFQGSIGGQITFYMIVSMFLQPHLDPPLLDGLVLLYNNQEPPGFVHINLKGILTPRLAFHVASRAITDTQQQRKRLIKDPTKDI